MKITFELVLTVVGTIASLILGILGIKYTLKHRNKTQLAFINNSCISLFKSVIKSLDDIEIKFKGKQIDKNLLLFKGTFFNTGNLDIDKSMIHNPIAITLPENYYWIQSKIIEVSPNTEVNNQIKDNKLNFNWGLLKSGEYFMFDAIVECREVDLNEIDYTDDLRKNVRFEHRITNLGIIERNELPAKPDSLLLRSITYIAILGLVLLFAYNSVFQSYPKYSVKNVMHVNGLSKEVEVKAISDSLLFIDGIDDNKEQSLSKFNTITKSVITTSIKKEGINYIAIIGWGILAIIFSLIFLILLIEDINDITLYKKMKIIADKYND